MVIHIGMGSSKPSEWNRDQAFLVHEKSTEVLHWGSLSLISQTQMLTLLWIWSLSKLLQSDSPFGVSAEHKKGGFFELQVIIFAQT